MERGQHRARCGGPGGRRDPAGPAVRPEGRGRTVPARGEEGGGAGELGMEVKVAVDWMGGDTGAHVPVPAVLGILDRDPAVSFILVGRQELIQRELAARHFVPNARVRIEHANETIGMDESPVTAMRTKKDSSM